MSIRKGKKVYWSVLQVSGDLLRTGETVERTNDLGAAFADQSCVLNFHGK
jgi:hypothetical protein